MNDAHPAKLAWLTDPEPGVFIFNVQTEEGELMRFQINRNQLLRLNEEVVKIVVKAFQ